MQPRIRRDRDGGIKGFNRLARPAQPGQAFAQRVQKIDMARLQLAGTQQQRQGALIVAGIHPLRGP